MMDDLAQLGPGAITSAAPSAREGTILDSPGTPGEAVRCAIEGRATEWMSWWPYSLPEGFFYPRTGDRAVVLYPVNGPPLLDKFWPADGRPPDVPA